MTRKEHDKLEQEMYPDQTITWTYEEEVKPTQVLIDIEAGIRTNKMINVFHLPHELQDEWEKKTQAIRQDASKTMLGLPTSVGFEVCRQHIADYLQKNCLQQHILILASTLIFSAAHDDAMKARAAMSGGDIFGILGQILGPNGPNSGK